MNFLNEIKSIPNPIWLLAFVILLASFMSGYLLGWYWEELKQIKKGESQ